MCLGLDRLDVPDLRRSGVGFQAIFSSIDGNLENFPCIGLRCLDELKEEEDLNAFRRLISLRLLQNKSVTTYILT
jgi:hypothetical protein